jgi:hypothetical protein
VRIVTLTNAAYTGYVLNWLESMRRAGMLREQVTVYCTDDESTKALSGHVNTERFTDVGGLSTGFLTWGSAPWKVFMWSKLELITRLLQAGEPVFFSDPDVFFHRDPRAWFDVKGVDVVAQQHLERGYSFMCDGFYCAYPTEATRRLFKPSRDEFGKWCNQEELLNARLVTEGVKWLGLPTNLFPDGSFGPSTEGWCCKSGERYVTHFNCYNGAEKLAKMKASGCWVVGEP